jgi:hypothetical protein
MVDDRVKGVVGLELSWGRVSRGSQDQNGNVVIGVPPEGNRPSSFKGRVRSVPFPPLKTFCFELMTHRRVSESQDGKDVAMGYLTGVRAWASD